MRVTAILTAAERKRQDRSVHRAEERRRRAKMMRVCGPTCPHSSVWAHASAVQAPKRLINKRKLAILTSNGMPLGECRLNVSLMWSLKALSELLASDTISIAVKSVDVVTYDADQAADIFWSVATASCAVNIARIWNTA